jgi:hypothetical protein
MATLRSELAKIFLLAKKFSVGAAMRFKSRQNASTRLAEKLLTQQEMTHSYG